MARRAIRKTDWGTIILHWALVVLLFIAVATGLRIAIDGPHDLAWLHSFDVILPQSIVWTAHIPAGTALFALAISYTIYLSKTGLFRRVKPGLARIRGLAGKAQARYSAINLLLYWVLFIALLIELVTGVMLYIGYGGWPAELHYAATWAIVGYIPCHIAIHYVIGGKVQLLRVLNPARLAPPTAEFDPYEFIAAHMTGDKAKPQALPAPEDQGQQRERRQNAPEPRRGPGRGQVVHAHPLPTAIAGGIAFLLLLLSLDSATREVLQVEAISPKERPVVDGDVSDPIWRSTSPVIVPTQQGANLDGNGQANVEIRAVQDGTNAYFAFVWDDPTRSLKHLPLTKTETGWRVLQQGFDRGDATAFFEDKFAVLLFSNYVLIPGDRTFHAGRQPLSDKPATLSGRGMHYTTDGGYADMWQWHAVNGGPAGWIDDARLGPPSEPTSAQKVGAAAYKGGFAPDPGSANFTLNFDERGPGGYDEPVRPKRLPKDIRKVGGASGRIDLNPNHSDPESSAWWMSEAESVPYTREQDAKIPVGTVIPGVLIAGNYGGDRADVRGAARWAAGHWSLEAVRKLDTGSKFDTPIVTGAYMRVSVFDHTQSRHTRHIRPVRLEVNRCGRVVECVSTTKDSTPIGAKSF